MNVFAEFFGHAGRFLGPRNHKGLSGADAGHTLDHVAVHARAYPEGEDVGIADMFANEIEDLGFDRHIAVGCNDDGARRASGHGSVSARFIAGKSSVPPAPCCCRIRSTARWILAGLAGTERSEKRPDAPENVITLNISVGRRPASSSSTSFFEISRKAVHRSGNIHDEDILARRNCIRRHALRRLGR